MAPLPEPKSVPGGPHPQGPPVSQGAHPQDGHPGHPAGWEHTLVSGRETRSALAPVGSLLNFLLGESHFDWLSPSGKFKSGPAGARANLCILLPGWSIFQAPAGQKHT